MSSEIFLGGNHSKIFQIWTGEGDNGKSITQILFEKMLGPYSIKLPTSLITGKRTQSSCACPELVRAGNGVRLATLQEPDQKDTINIGILKELSGNDTFFARGLYKEGTEITPMFKLVLICNEPPKLPYNDRATWNRIRVIPFESTFTDSAPDSWEEQLLKKQFPKDKDFADKIPRMLEPFAWLLLHRLKSKQKILIEPEKVKLATINYRKKNDIYKQFIDEFIIAKSDSSISLMELYSVFKDWYRDSMPNCSNNMPTKNELKDYFVKSWGPPIDKIRWNGYEIRNVFESKCSLDINTVPL
jgi:phage/plasmid-associated DNA primase